LRLITCITLAALTACGAAAPHVQEVQAPRVIVRIQWPDGNLFPYAVEFRYSGHCDAVNFGHRARSMVGEFAIQWPFDCRSTTMDLVLDLEVNWMRCMAPRAIKRIVVPGDVIAVFLDEGPECRRI
jgi:hypothetical protein